MEVADAEPEPEPEPVPERPSKKGAPADPPDDLVSKKSFAAKFAMDPKVVVKGLEVQVSISPFIVPSLSDPRSSARSPAASAACRCCPARDLCVLLSTRVA